MQKMQHMRYLLKILEKKRAPRSSLTPAPFHIIYEMITLKIDTYGIKFCNLSVKLYQNHLRKQSLLPYHPEL